MIDEQEQAATRLVQMLARNAARMDYEKAITEKEDEDDKVK